MRIGVLTGGGDCPGLNAAIRAIVKQGITRHGSAMVGFRNGWRGVTEGDSFPLDREDVSGILTAGGTMLGTARFHPHKVSGALDKVTEVFEAEKLDAFICIGGDGTLKAAHKVHTKTGIPVVGIPKTIDNDVVGTDASIGFDTAVAIATEAIDRLHSTAESHNRVMGVELMGRHAGWIAVSAGIAAGADIILAPEDPFDIDNVVRRITHRHRVKDFSIVAIAEGAVPEEGSDLAPDSTLDHKGNPIAGEIGRQVTEEIQKRTGFPARLTVLGYVQRGGVPTAADRLLASRFGSAAVEAVHAKEFGTFTALRGQEIVMTPLKEMAGKTNFVPPELLELARAL